MTKAQARDDFLQPVINSLRYRAAFICSNPDCRRLTVAPSDTDDTKFLYIGKAAHISAAAKGGSRYDPTMSSDARKSAANGIFLCSNCAEMIDKNGGIDFPIEQLTQWKRDHDAWVTANLNKRPSESTLAASTITVTSIGQQGGITAGIINARPTPRQLNDSIRQQLTQHLPDTSRPVTINSLSNDREAYAFATQIKTYLQTLGYDILGVNNCLFLSHGDIAPLKLNPDTRTITVSSQP